MLTKETCLALFQTLFLLGEYVKESIFLLAMSIPITAILRKNSWRNKFFIYRSKKQNQFSP
jgi:hypothetical protein